MTPWKDELTARAQADADDPAGHHGLRADHRLRERRQPDAHAPGARASARWRSARRSARAARCCVVSCSPRTSSCRSSAECWDSGLAVAGLDLLTRYASRFTSRTGEIALDGWVLSFTLIVSIALALVFAWAPRLGFLADPVRAMASGGGRATGNPGRRRAQRALVVSQLAASFMLLIGAGLLTRSLLQLYAVDPGFDLANVLSLQAPDFTGLNRERRLQFSRDVLERVRSEATVQSAAMASAAPLAGSFPQLQEFQVGRRRSAGGRLVAEDGHPRRQRRLLREQSARGSSPAAGSRQRRSRRRRRSWS